MEWFTDWFFGWFYDMLYILQKSICVIIDFICEIFYMLAGLDTVSIDGVEEDLLSHFLLSDSVRTAFLGVLLVGVALLLVFVIIAIIRSEAADGQQKKTKGQILIKAGHSLLIFIVIPFLLLAGIMLVNAIMGAVDASMNLSAAGGGRSTFGGQILVTSGNSAFKGSESQRAAIEQQFINGTLDYNNISVVKQYYDLTDMNYFVGIASGLLILIMFVIAVISFVQRIFDIILLYIISPISVSTIPVDDGSRFRLWKEMLISKVLGAYGIILSMNLFFLIVPQVSTISFFGNSFKDGIVTLLFVIGGAFSVTKANMVIAQLTGNNAGAQEAQQLMSNIHTGARIAKTGWSGAAAIGGRLIGGSDYTRNKKKGEGFGENVKALTESNRNQKTKDEKTAGKAANRSPVGKVASGALRMATMPAGVLKDMLQGGAITAGKNIGPRMRNVFAGSSWTNRAEVKKKPVTPKNKPDTGCNTSPPALTTPESGADTAAGGTTYITTNDTSDTVKSAASVGGVKSDNPSQVSAPTGGNPPGTNSNTKRSPAANAKPDMKNNVVKKAAASSGESIAQPRQAQQSKETLTSNRDSSAAKHNKPAEKNNTMVRATAERHAETFNQTITEKTDKGETKK